ncbi:MAG: transposase [Burkholderiales bacterium]|nr:transposase [Burkholderiales bacterium]
MLVGHDPPESPVTFDRNQRSSSAEYAALVNSRWPAGFACPSCGGSRHSTFERKGL